MHSIFPQQTLMFPELFCHFTYLAASSSVRLRLRRASAPLSSVVPVFGSQRPERADSDALTSSYVKFGMELSLLVPAGGGLCQDVLVVADGMGAAPAVVGPDSLNMSNNGHRLTPLKVISDGARQRRSGGGPGGGCARRPVGTYLYLHAIGVGNHVIVP
jgi:hypothetical protein